MSDSMTEVPHSDPLRMLWEKYKTTSNYANTRKWAMHEEHIDGALWTVFIAGYQAIREVEREGMTNE